MTRCLSLLLAMMVSAELAKQLTMEVKMEVLTELQVVGGLGFLLQVLQTLWMRVRAAITLERLWLWSSRRVMRSEIALTGVEVVRLMDRDGGESERREEHSLIGQELSG